MPYPRVQSKHRTMLISVQHPGKSWRASEFAKQKSMEKTLQAEGRAWKTPSLPNSSASLILKHIIIINRLVHVKSLRVISVNSKFSWLDFDVNESPKLTG